MLSGCCSFVLKTALFSNRELSLLVTMAFLANSLKGGVHSAACDLHTCGSQLLSGLGIFSEGHRDEGEPEEDLLSRGVS